MPPNNRELVTLVARQQQAQDDRLKELRGYINTIATALQGCRARLDDLEKRNEQEDQRRSEAEESEGD